MQTSSDPGETLVDAIRSHARSRPDDTALVFTSGGGDSETLTYAELDRRARAFGAGLSAAALSDGPVLLAMRSDAGSVTALLGCFYAGIPCAPVPVPPRNGSTLRLRAFAEAGRASAVLIPDDASYLAAALPELRVLERGAMGRDEGWTPGPGTDSALALVQYTSGSSSAPKGVRLTHANIYANLEMLRVAFALRSDDRFASWLPLFHDMGLAMLLMPLHFGVPGIVMPPLTFLRRPERWLEIVGSYGATITGAPNFAYETCVRRIDETTRAGLDLRSLRIAFCGAEPVRRATMRRFAQGFAASGFRADALYPCYGMAEAVTFVSGGHLSPDDLSEEDIAGGDARPVSCGRLATGSEVAIIDPLTLETRADGAVGEVCIAGPHIGAGYLGAPEATHANFGVRLADRPGRAFLRTGDLGFSQDGALTITGRLKDVIVHRGGNIHAADVEGAVAACHTGFGGAGAAFAWTVDGEEHVVLIHEAARGLDDDAYGAMRKAALEAVAQHHGVRLHDLVLVRAGSVPKTSSGKVRREACRELYVRGDLQVVASRDGAGPPPRPAPVAPEMAARVGDGDRSRDRT